MNAGSSSKLRVWRALFRREWLEHQTSYLWVPVGTFVVIAVAISLTLLFAQLGRIDVSGLMNTGGADLSLRENLHLLLAKDGINQYQIGQMLGGLNSAIAKLFVWVYLGVAAMVLLNSLFDDRRDRTVLFWKSVPVADSQTVFSKLIATVWFAPLIVIAMLLLTQVFLLGIASVLLSGNGRFEVTSLWASSGLLGSLFKFLFGFLIQGFWTLPIFSWLLFVSSIVRKSPMFYAISLPLVPVLLEWAALGTSHFSRFVIDHASLEAIPVSREVQEGVAATVGVEDMLALCMTPSMWVGLVVSAILLGLTIYYRRRNNEI